MFVQLPNGRLINEAHIIHYKPVSNMWRLTYSNGTHEDFGGGDADTIREQLIPVRIAKKPRKRIGGAME